MPEVVVDDGRDQPDVAWSDAAMNWLVKMQRELFPGWFRG